MDRDAELARQLDQAFVKKRTIPRITIAHPDLSVQDAYRIQRLGIDLRLSRGEKQVGYKMGLTSKVKQEQMNVHNPICGVYTNIMQILDGGVCQLDHLIQPKCEPEIAFIIDKEIKGVVTPNIVLASCSQVCAAIDIIDSRYDHFKFTLSDVIADNCSSGGFVLSHERLDPKCVDLANLPMTFLVNNITVSTGSSSAILGNPINSVVELARILSEQGLTIPSGSIVLCGAAMMAVDLKTDMKVGLHVEGLGSVRFSSQ